MLQCLSPTAWEGADSVPRVKLGWDVIHIFSRVTVRPQTAPLALPVLSVLIPMSGLVVRRAMNQSVIFLGVKSVSDVYLHLLWYICFPLTPPSSCFFPSIVEINLLAIYIISIILSIELVKLYDIAVLHIQVKVTVKYVYIKYSFLFTTRSISCKH